MSRKFVVLAAAILAVLMFASLSSAQGMFVATAKNARGALYRAPAPHRAMPRKWLW